MADKQSKTKLKKFFEENRTLVFTIPAIIILLIVVILIYALRGNDTKISENITPTPEPNQQTEQQVIETEKPESSTDVPSNSGTEGTTLPQTERDKDIDEISRNPFADPYKVSGIIYDKSGDSFAIIEAENKSFIVKTGDQSGDYFKVLNIEEDRVVLEVDGQQLVLTLSAD